MNGTFTADAHMQGRPQNLGLDPLTSIVLGGEDAHADHHASPSAPRHARYDPGYALVRLLEKAGLATVPARKRGMLDKRGFAKRG